MDKILKQIEILYKTLKQDDKNLLKDAVKGLNKSVQSLRASPSLTSKLNQTFAPNIYDLIKLIYTVATDKSTDSIIQIETRARALCPSILADINSDE
jgi:hypothetical protein